MTTLDHKHIDGLIETKKCCHLQRSLQFRTILHNTIALIFSLETPEILRCKKSEKNFSLLVKFVTDIFRILIYFY